MLMNFSFDELKMIKKMYGDSLHNIFGLMSEDDVEEYLNLYKKISSEIEYQES